MGVDFRGEDRFVTKHLLHSSQVGPILYKFSGKTVAQRMGTDMLMNAGVDNRLLQKQKDHLACQMPTASVEEDILLFSWLHRQV